MKTGQWVNVQLSTGEIHVLPVDDLRDHEQTDCWCNPARDGDCDEVVIHNAADQRERYETGELKPQ
jgi:hypothetical protein